METTKKKSSKTKKKGSAIKGEKVEYTFDHHDPEIGKQTVSVISVPGFDSGF